MTPSNFSFNSQVFPVKNQLQIKLPLRQRLPALNMTAKQRFGSTKEDN
jgi:hypothetical protein